METDQYTGNFERELVAYAVGRLDSAQEQIGYADLYVRVFWEHMWGSGCTSYQKYKEVNIEEGEEDEYLQFFHNALCHTYQVVDDWEQVTFYHISNRDNTGEKYTCIDIQLSVPDFDSTDSPYYKFGDTMIRRIVEFCELPIV